MNLATLRLRVVRTIALAAVGVSVVAASLVPHSGAVAAPVASAVPPGWSGPASIAGDVTLGAERLVPADGTVEIVVEGYPPAVDGLEQPLVEVARVALVGGRYSATGLAARNYRLTARYLPDDRYLPSTLLASPGLGGAGLHVTRDFVLNVGYVVEGQVVVGNSRVVPTPGLVRLELMSGDRAVVTTLNTANGAYRLSGIPFGRFAIRMTYLGVEDYPVWHEPGGRRWSGAAFAVHGDLSGKNLALAPGGAVVGRVIDSAGFPLAAIEVRASNGLLTTSRVDGSYQFAGFDPLNGLSVAFRDPSGRRPAAVYPGWSEFYEPVSFDVGADDTVHLEDVVLPRSGAIRGIINTPGFRIPSEGREYELAAWDDGAGDWVLTGEVEWTNQWGQFEISGLMPDTYRVVSRAYRGPTGFLASGDIEVLEDGVAEWIGSMRLITDGPDRDISAADDNDDVAVVDGSGNLLVYEGKRTGGWGDRQLIGSGWNAMSTIAVAGDFGGDGHPDVIGQDPQGRLWMYPLTDWGYFKDRRQIGQGWQGFSSIFSPGDFDSDGNHDLIARDASGNLHLYRGDGGGGWAGSRVIGWGWSSMTSILGPGDFDDDGHVDIIARDSAGGLWLYPGSQGGAIQPGRQIGVGWQGFTSVISIGRFDDNDSPDIAARDAAGRLWLYPHGGDVKFGAPRQIGSGWNGLYFSS